MQSPSSQRGEMSQDSASPSLHRNVVKPVDFGIFAARRERYSYNTMSATSVGMELGLSVVIALLIGYYLDGYLGTTPWLMFAWLGLGLFSGFRGVVRAMNRADRAAASEASRG